VHIGIGAFHRAHMAVYTDDAMAVGETRWAIAGVSLRSREVRDAMAPQDCLYTVTTRSAQGETVRLIGAVVEVIAAPDTPNRVIDLLAAPGTHVATLTVSEKGYVRAAGGGLDFADVDIAHDLRLQASPRTLYGYLAHGLRRRRAAGLPGLTILSCDNLTQNGAQLAAALGAFLERCDADLGRWVEAECAFPCSMVDRIVPATTPTDIDRIGDLLGVRDQAAVVTEPFRQLVIENKFSGPRPLWEAGGAVFVDDVAGYESAKLRTLNGAHSALAYLGLARGYAYVHEAIADPDLAALATDLMSDAAASLMGKGPEPREYAKLLIARFRNRALAHRLSQIAMDGSQKTPQRWLEVLRANARSGRACAAHLKALAAWIDYVKGDDHPVDDPLAAQLRGLWAVHGRAGVVGALIGQGGLFARTWEVPDQTISEVSALLVGP